MIPIASRTNGKASWASATVMMTASSRPPPKPARRPRTRTKATPASVTHGTRRPCRRGHAVGAGNAAASVGTDAGIEEPIDQVDGEVDHDEHERGEEDRALHDGVVAVVDRLHGEP